MTIVSMPNNKKFDENYDRIFKKETKKDPEKFVGLPDGSFPCFCVGPQPGETKCPCALKYNAKYHG